MFRSMLTPASDAVDCMFRWWRPTLYIALQRSHLLWCFRAPCLIAEARRRAASVNEWAANRAIDRHVAAPFIPSVPMFHAWKPISAESRRSRQQANVACSTIRYSYGHIRCVLVYILHEYVRERGESEQKTSSCVNKEQKRRKTAKAADAATVHRRIWADNAVALLLLSAAVLIQQRLLLPSSPANVVYPFSASSFINPSRFLAPLRNLSLWI